MPLDQPKALDGSSAAQDASKRPRLSTPDVEQGRAASGAERDPDMRAAALAMTTAILGAAARRRVAMSGPDGGADGSPDPSATGSQEAKHHG